jgi:hypothetical protein
VFSLDASIVRRPSTPVFDRRAAALAAADWRTPLRRVPGLVPAYRWAKKMAGR